MRRRTSAQHRLVKGVAAAHTAAHMRAGIEGWPWLRGIRGPIGARAQGLDQVLGSHSSESKVGPPGSVPMLQSCQSRCVSSCFAAARAATYSSESNDHFSGVHPTLAISSTSNCLVVTP